MSQALYGRLKARPTKATHSDVPSSATVTHPFSYPVWIKALFATGVFLFLASIISLIVSPLVSGLPRTDILFGIAALGMGALLVVTKVASAYRP